MRILVAGASGQLGSEICRRSRAHGIDTRALLRPTTSPEKRSHLHELGCEIVEGDLGDRKALEGACRDVTAVVSTVSPVVAAGPCAGDVPKDGGHGPLVDAARTAVGRFAFISADMTGLPPSPLTREKAAVEELLRTSGMVYTILRPAYFMESWLGPMLGVDVAARTAKVYGDGTRPRSYISVADVAEATVFCLTQSSAENAVVPLAAPLPVTQRDAIALFEETLGDRLDVTAIPEDALVAQSRSTSDPFLQSLFSLMLGAAHGGVADLAVQRELRVPVSRSVRDFVESSVTPA